MYEERKERIVQQSDTHGITLIALVITIVVLVILASVAINLSLGNNGIFNKAKYAREIYLNTKNEEETKLSKVKNYIDNTRDQVNEGDANKEDVLEGKVFSSSEKTGIIGTMPNIGKFEKTISAGEEVTIPKGYHDGSGSITAKTFNSTPVFINVFNQKQGNTTTMNLTGLTENKKYLLILIDSVSSANTGGYRTSISIADNNSFTYTYEQDKGQNNFYSQYIYGEFIAKKSTESLTFVLNTVSQNWYFNGTVMLFEI